MHGGIKTQEFDIKKSYEYENRKIVFCIIGCHANKIVNGTYDRVEYRKSKSIVSSIVYTCITLFTFIRDQVYNNKK